MTYMIMMILRTFMAIDHEDEFDSFEDAEEFAGMKLNK